MGSPNVNPLPRQPPLSPPCDDPEYIHSQQQHVGRDRGGRGRGLDVRAGLRPVGESRGAPARGRLAGLRFFAQDSAALRGEIGIGQAVDHVHRIRAPGSLDAFGYQVGS
jgi:hypothetical protein